MLEGLRAQEPMFGKIRVIVGASCSCWLYIVFETPSDEALRWKKSDDLSVVHIIFLVEQKIFFFILPPHALTQIDWSYAVCGISSWKTSPHSHHKARHLDNKGELCAQTNHIYIYIWVFLLLCFVLANPSNPLWLCAVCSEKPSQDGYLKQTTCVVKKCVECERALCGTRTKYCRFSICPRDLVH